MARTCRRPKIRAWSSASNGYSGDAFGRDKVTIIASPGIADFGAWLEQLLAEITGKQGKGLIPLQIEPLDDARGLRQRSIVRLPRADGEARCNHRTRRWLRWNAQAIRSCTSGQRPLSHRPGILPLGDCRAVAGSILGINPFDQPDVEASKDKTRELTAALRETDSLPSKNQYSARTVSPFTRIRATPRSLVGTTH